MGNDNTAIVKKEPLEIFMSKPETVSKFIGLFSNEQEVRRYVQSVIILVNSSDPGEYSLMNCTNESILNSALRAVSLRVSVDPAVRQAWLVPRRNKKNGNQLEANLQLHYAEIRNRAMRTNRYWFINVSPVYEGETVMVNVYSGFHQIKLANGLMTSPTQQDGFVPVNQRRGKRIGWLGYFKTKKGEEQTVYMSTEDIVAFVTLHNPYWTSSLSWKNNRDIMEQKTVLLALLRKADLGDPDMAEVKDIINADSGFTQDEDVVDGESSDLDDNQESEEQRAEATKKVAPQSEKKSAPVAPPAPVPAPEAAHVDPPGRPYAPATFREKFLEGVKAIEANYAESGKTLEVTTIQRSMTASVIDKVFGGNKLHRHEFCNWLIGKTSTADMTPAEIKVFMQIMKIVDYKSACEPTVAKEILLCHEEAKRVMKETQPA